MEEAGEAGSKGRLQEIVPPKRFPVCIVWVPIPLITWLFPPIGHMGIGLSNGVILDFAGPRFISVDRLSFGNPTRYMQLRPTDTAQWDDALERSATMYQDLSYNILTNNCHQFVAHSLNLMSYGGRQNWEMIHIPGWQVSLAILLFFKGSFVDASGAVKTWLPFLLLVAGGLSMGASALMYWAYCMGPLIAWFLLYSFVISSPRDLLLRTPNSKAKGVTAESVVDKLLRQEEENLSCARAGPACCSHKH